MDFRIIKKARNGEVLWHNQYKFKRTKSTQLRKYWMCATCRMTCITEGERFIKRPQEHGDECTPAMAQEITENAIGTMRQRMMEEPTAAKRVYEEEIRNVWIAADGAREEITALLPRFDSLQTALYRARRHNQPLLPRNLANLQLGQDYERTLDGQRFLLRDTGVGPNRILMFGTDASLRLLSTRNKIWLDGTFKSCPEIFEQILSVHCMASETIMVPVVYCLLPGKSQEIYNSVLDIIRDEMGQRNLALNINRFCVDYEPSLMLSLRFRFLGSTMEGCYFHFCQCLHRQVQSLGLKTCYNSNGGNNELRRYVRRHGALALLPLDQIDPVRQQLLANRPQLPDGDALKLDAFDNYFTRQWMTNTRLWNHWANQGPRTNNHLEGYHSKLNGEFNKSHPSIYRFLKVLQNHEADFRIKIAMAQAGNAPPKRNTKYVQMDNRIRHIQGQYTAGQQTAMDICQTLAYFTGMP